MSKTSGVGSWQFDLSGVKVIDSFSNVEVRLRLLLLVPLSIQLAWWLENPFFLYLMATYIVVLILYLWMITKMPRRVGLFGFIGVLAAGAITFAVFMTAPLMLWIEGTEATKFLSLMLLFAAMINTISPRAVETAFLILDLGVTTSVALLMIWIEVQRNPDPVTVFVVGVSIMALLLYHLQAIRGIVRFRGRLRRFREGQEEGDRQRAIGQLVGGVAHDFNNLLTVVIGNLQLYDAVSDPDERRELLREAERAATRGADLTGQLLAFSRKSQLHPEPVQVPQIVRDVKPLVDRLLGERHRLIFHVGSNTPEIEVDLAKLQAVLINLVLNARDALPEGGDIQFHASASRALNRPTLSFKVADKGTGIPKALLEQVFEPYFTTKPVGKGSGLGLSMAKGFVEQSGGRLDLTSKEGHGTQIELHFPAIAPRHTP